MTRRHIKTIRAWLGLSQAELAARLGVRTATVGRWEAGISTPGGPATLKLVALWRQVQGEFVASQAA